MSTLQKVLLCLFVLLLLVGAILTYPSIGSLILITSLILSFPIYFIQRFLNR